MNLLEKLVEKTLERSPLLKRTAEAFERLATEVHNLSLATGALAQVVQAHHAALAELYARQGMVMKAIKSNSLDTTLNAPKTKEPAKPN